MHAPQPMPRNALEHAAISDVGLRRANNQDSFVVVVSHDRNEWLRRGHLFMVADGMGAHAAGELASKMATDGVSLTYFKSPQASPVDAIQEAFREANRRIHLHGSGNAEFRGMGTTSSALMLLPEGAVVAHVGDSRVYRLRGELLDQLSFDHSLVWELRATGRFGEAEQLQIPKNIITRSMGPSPEVQVDLEGPFAVERGDVYLLCSDGLSGQVTDEEIGAILSALSPHEAVQALVDLANLRGGPDNITVIVVKVKDHLAGAAPGAELSPARGAARPVPLASWIVLGTAMLAALSMAALGQWIAAGVAAVVAIATSLYIMAIRSPANDGTLGATPLGKGPHRTTSCAANARVTEQLAKLVAQLQTAAVEEHWDIDWQRFNTLSTTAAEAARRKDYQATVREQCHAISFMMAELRRHSMRKEPPPTSS